MKKKVGIVLAVLLGFSAMGFGMLQSSASQTEPKLSYDEVEKLVTDQYPGEVVDRELEKDRNRAVYELEIRSEGKEYDIEVDGNTGEILELDERKVAGKVNNSKDDNADDKQGDDDNKDDGTKKSDDKNNSVSIKEKDDSKGNKDDDRDDRNESNKDDDHDDKNESTKKNTSSNKTAISSSKAKQIAKNAFNGSIISIDLDEDDGRRIYEVEMKSKNKEAEIEIDAYTGEVIVLSIDTNDDRDDKDDKDDDENDDDDDNDDNDDNDGGDSDDDDDNDDD
ncbi:PepSY domain-containing protein [Virgibacillus doumboii]|uniref:PepSY domain-containing protein n=1 Tax=Virgibacillus doumboii TaxID=2697503 RepID=UPI0013E0D8FC|nr:PepSY domain-containing protein [Virgibacillus doumboii]